jgi:hypothetical protein
MRQRLKAREKNMEGHGRSYPDKIAGSMSLNGRMKKVLAEKNEAANIMMSVRDINYISLIGEYDQGLGDNDNLTIEDLEQGGKDTIEDEGIIE